MPFLIKSGIERIGFEISGSCSSEVLRTSVRLTGLHLVDVKTIRLVKTGLQIEVFSHIIDIFPLF